MKKILLLTVALLFTSTLFSGCKNQNKSKEQNSLSSEMSTEEKEIVKKEISAVGKFVIENAAKLDPETAMKPYLNDPEFLVINTDATYGDYAKMRTSNIEAFKQLFSFKQTTIKEEFRFLTKMEVLYTWFGKNEIELKTGGKITNESYIGTMLFKKINNKWKIVYAHESASPAIEEKVRK